jgi:hypothetical protein
VSNFRILTIISHILFGFHVLPYRHGHGNPARKSQAWASKCWPNRRAKPGLGSLRLLKRHDPTGCGLLIGPGQALGRSGRCIVMATHPRPDPSISGFGFFLFRFSIWCWFLRFFFQFSVVFYFLSIFLFYFPLFCVYFSRFIFLFKDNFEI